MADTAGTNSAPDAPLSLGSVAHALRSTAAHVEHTMSRTLEPFGLTTAQFAALEILESASNDPLACGELRGRLAGVAPDVTRLLDRLESVSLVARVRDTNDRRIVHTHITDKGRDLLTQVRPAAREAEERMFGGLSFEQREALSALLAGVHGNCPAV